MQAVETTHRTWTVMFSATMQTAVVGSAVLLSIVQFQTLDLRGLVQPPPLVAPYHGPVQVVAVERMSTTSRMAAPSHEYKPFTAPPSIPRGLARIVDPEPGGPAIEVLPQGFIASENAMPLSRIVGMPAAFSRVAPPPPPAPKGPARVATREPMRIGGNVLEARIIRKVIPVYPANARSSRISGIVHLIGTIDRDGKVQRLQVVDGHPWLANAALDAVRQWSYRPTLLNGEPVEVVAPIEVKFLLN